MKSLLLLAVSSSRRWTLIFLKTQLSCQRWFRLPYSAAGTWPIHGIAFFCIFSSRNWLYALRSVEKLEFLTDPWISSLFQTSAHFFPRLVSWLLRTGDLLIPGTGKGHVPQERLSFRSNRRAHQNSFILRPSPFRLPLSTIPQLSFPNYQATMSE